MNTTFSKSYSRVFNKSNLRKANKIIYFDLDDTLVDTAGGFRRILKERYNITVSSDNSYLTDEITDNKMSVIIKSHWQGEMKLFERLTSINKYFKLLRKAGYAIAICTHRPPEYHSIERTVRFLVNNNLDVDIIHFLCSKSHSDKMQWLRHYNGHNNFILFDDWPVNHSKEMVSYSNLYLIDRIENRHIEVVNRITINDILPQLEKLLE